MKGSLERGGASRAESFDEEGIIDDILGSVTTSQDKKSGSQHFLLYYGSKMLDLYYRESQRVYAASIEASKDSARASKETTLLYRAAKKLMNARVNKDGKAAQYVLRTESEKLISWAMNDGEIIFHWSDHRISDGGHGADLHEFMAEILPKQMVQ